jgi:hypothetical protein
MNTKRVHVRSEFYVWCDVCGEIHPATKDYYEMGDDDCGPVNWRPVFVLGDREEAGSL